jgi:lipoyl-dependent peroxiredoxin
MDVQYTAIAHARGDGRNGHVETEDGTLSLEMRVPAEMGGPGGGANPELLFAAGYATCFHSALRLVGRKLKANTEGSAVSASIGIGRLESGGMGLTAALDVHLPQVSRAEAEQLVAAAHEVCPYSNATRGNIDVQITLV